MATYQLLWLVFATATVPAQKVVNLSGSTWTIQNLALNISVPASLPSQAHLDLYQQKVIGDP